MAGARIVVAVHERQSGIAGFLTELGAIVESAMLPSRDYVGPARARQLADALNQPWHRVP